LGAVWGVLGVAVAAPLVTAAIVVVRMLYVEDVLHDYSADKIEASG
jgi:hypothetical protein